MKKVYTKPEIFFDSFELSQSIAAGCEGISQHAEGACAVYVKEIGLSVFSTREICDYYSVELQDSVCYHAPSDSNNVYSS